MSALLWPGDELAGDVFGDAAMLEAMVAVEGAWSAALVNAEIAPRQAAAELAGLTSAADLPALAAESAATGNPVPALVALLRTRVQPTDPLAATWLHRGLTSQDVLDTALISCARDATERLAAELATQIAALTALAISHRSTPMIARTLTQHAVPTTFGAKVATWLHGLLDAADDLQALRFPAQFGGAAGTRAALVELAALAGAADPGATAAAVCSGTAAALGLDNAEPWHTSRAPLTRIGGALLGCTAAFGHIADDVLTLARPEIDELAEPSVAGRGGSSTMPQKQNPVLSVLIRRAALAAPAFGSQLQLAAADAVDERADGAWHLEWQALQLLARHAVTAAVQTSTLVNGLQVDTARMQQTVEGALPGAHAERDSMRALFDAAPPGHDTYLDAAAAIADVAVARATASTA